MGVWGPGVLDSDGASDYLGDVCCQLIWAADDRLELLATSPRAEEEGLAFLSLIEAVLMGLRKSRYNLSKPRVARWKLIYMAWFEKECKLLIDPGDYQAFHDHRTRLFDKLFDLAGGDDDMDATLAESKASQQIKL